MVMVNAVALNVVILNTVEYNPVHLGETRGLYYKILRIRNLQKNDKFHRKLASSGLDEYTSLDKPTR
jgi:hypothetical protein